jgi:hypothetical protein
MKMLGIILVLGVALCSGANSKAQVPPPKHESRALSDTVHVAIGRNVSD